MVDIMLADKVWKGRLSDRLLRSEYGRILLLSKDRKRGTWLTALEVNNVIKDIARATAPSERLVKLSCWVNIPFAMALLGLSGFVPGLIAWIDSQGDIASLFAGLLVLAGLPLVVLFRHYLTVRRTVRSVEDQLDAREWILTPPLEQRSGLDSLERLGLLIAVPNAILATVHAFDPDILRNTPLVGTTLSPLSIAIVVALAIRRLTNRSAQQLVATSPPESSMVSNRRKAILEPTGHAASSESY